VVSGVFAFGGFDDFDAGRVLVEVGGDVFGGLPSGIVAVLDDGYVPTG
jgi:hypothetical protein